jgi:hypothetical protein
VLTKACKLASLCVRACVHGFADRTCKMQCPPQDAEAVSQCVQKAVMARLAWIQLASEPEPEPEPPQAAAPAPADEAAEFHTPRPEAAEEGVPPEGVTAEDDV